MGILTNEQMLDPFIKESNYAWKETNLLHVKSKSNPTTGLVAFGVSGRLRFQNF